MANKTNLKIYKTTIGPNKMLVWQTGKTGGHYFDQKTCAARVALQRGCHEQNGGNFLLV